ncbi:hypothetical protein NONO_c59700 [Nocardia nova SH22a]|uniref:Uncharacterized protein n=1 Tax=Nocardia nova SH22a TaxID=1415166 RepID=W5TU66_9NOCA|nr:hypothetical protein [Nocardia nova]AHH20746.1 hypothetical protein NONO_c59700 [Nocardia nova SH22a]
MISASPAQIDIWRERHRFCGDTPSDMSLDEARFILNEHSGHGPACSQFLAALERGSAVMQ